MTENNDPDRPESPVDPGVLSVSRVLSQYPVAKLSVIVASLLAAGFGAGYWLRDKLSSEELRNCQVEYRTLEKHASALQQAINSGQCVKSEFLAQQEDARRLLGRLEIVNRTVESVRQGVLGTRPSPLVSLQNDYWTSIDLGRFLDDPRVSALISEMSEITIRLDDKLHSAWGVALAIEQQREVIRDAEAKGQPLQNIAGYKASLAAQENSMAETTKLMDQLQAALVRTREYLKSKYVISAGP